MLMDKRTIKKEIKSKSEFYDLYNNYLLGNRPLAWNNLNDVLNSDYKGTITIRDAKGTKRGDINAILPMFLVPTTKLKETIKQLEEKGISKTDMKFNQSMPDDYLTIQGELLKNHNGINLLYTNIPKPMNIALKQQTLHAKGLKAELILKHFLWPSSYEEIKSLLDFFSHEDSSSSSVIEFSTYSIPVGHLPGRNTVIWEVRDF